MQDLRSGNDNLKVWREAKAELTEQLLKKSIDELIKLNAIINYKTVCEMMDRIASIKDKEFNAVISPSAISKNEIYKNIILEAKERIKTSENKKQNYKLDGDKQLEIFQLKSQIAKREVKIRNLESIINRANIQTNNISNTSIQKNEFDFKDICNDLKNFILKEGVGYLDGNSNLIDESTGNILVSQDIIKALNFD